LPQVVANYERLLTGKIEIPETEEEKVGLSPISER
jgi:hypothetical protein